ncbi:hypothetical protein [Bacillus cereus group sp. N21]|uniref:hypothetical protein n=1 Tax=Bacillus cereus group sp. N21 TaxID=2794591 RepID=UPI0018F2E1ED|nr:hypothetical protein [Bacillus cereus group sp. N21]MBJ8031402.1 hypothetical protein [Bacillus cereus group sp. N21]
MKANDYKQVFEDFWKKRVTDEQGNLDEDKVKRELSDYKYLLDQVPTVYSELAGLSKPFYSAQTIIDRARENQEEYARDIYLEDIKQMVEEDGTVQLSDIEGYFNK